MVITDIASWFGSNIEAIRLIVDVALTGGLVYFAYVTIRESRRWTSIDYIEKRLEKLYSPALHIIKKTKGNLFLSYSEFVSDYRMKSYSALGEIDGIMKDYLHLASDDLRQLYWDALEATNADDPRITKFCTTVEDEWKDLNDAHEEILGRQSFPWRLVHRVFDITRRRKV